MNDIYKNLNKHKKYLESMGYTVVYIGLYGSQNYNLHDDESDFDSKAIVLPKFEDLLTKRDHNKVFDYEDGQIDVKDIMSYYELVRKGNYSYLEAIHSDYFLGNKDLRNLFLKQSVNPMGMIGMMKQKEDAIKKNLPNSYEKMDLYGYDPKHYHHSVKLYKTLLYMNQTKDFNDFMLKFSRDDRKDLLQIKREVSKSKSEVLEHMSLMIEECEQLYKGFKFESLDIESEFLNLSKSLIIEELVNTSGLDYYVNQNRTFSNNVPKRDKHMFPQLETLEKNDISYAIYSYLEILDWGDPYKEEDDENL